MNTKETINDEFSSCLVVTNDSNCSRCESNESIQLPTCSSSTFDSGNISSSNLSDISSLIDFHLYPFSMSSAEDGLVTKSIKDSISESDWYSLSKLQGIIREKDQSLILAFQDIRKLRSEQERLSKSEKWYKAELKSQKSARRELVEKVYLKEREHVQQMQSLHADCTKHQTICNELKRELQKEKSIHLKEINKLKCQQEKLPISSISVDYQNTRNANIIEDQKVTIEVLRNQKQTLLNDLNVLENEKDAKILDLQKDHAELINENRQLTKKCMQLMETRKSLEEKLLNDHECITKLQELLDLKQQQPLTPSVSNDLNLSLANSNRFNQTEENLEKENICLQEKLDTLQRENELMHLEHKKLDETTQMELQEKCLEIENLNIFQTQNCKHIQQLEQQINDLLDVQHELKNSIELMDAQLKETSNEKEQVTAQSEIIKQLKETIGKLNERISSQSSDILVLKDFEREYLNLDKKYNKIYKMCEKSKFELDVKAIEIKKLQFERDNSYKEVMKLRERIKNLTVRTQLYERNATDLDKAKSQLYQLQITNNDYVTQIAKLRNELLIREQSYKTTANKNVELKERFCKLSQQLHSSECKARQLTMDLAAITDCNNAAKTSNEQACILETELKKLSIANEMYEKNLQIAENEIANYKNQMQEFRKKCTSLRNYIISESYNENEQSHMVSKQRVKALQSLLELQSSKVTHLNQETNEWTNFLDFVLTAPLFENAPSYFNRDHFDAEINDNSVENLRSTEALQQKIQILNSEVFRCKQLNELWHNEVSAAIERERINFSQFETLLTSQIEFLTIDKEKLEQELTEFQNKSKNENFNINDGENCKLLYEILEEEHKNKIARMELNLSALENSKQFYKNCIKITEEQYSTFIQNCEIAEVDQMRFSIPCDKCEIINFKYQDCLQTITKLQNQLKTERNQFAEIEMYKRSNAEMKKRIAKLLCDKKDLIQFIPTTKNYATNKIDDLIDRSKNSVPNLIKLSKSVDGLKDDIQKLLQTTVSAGRSSPLFIRKKSLMYELKQADADYLPCT